MDNFLKLISELEEKKDTLESELIKIKGEQEAIGYVISEKEYCYGKMKEKEKTYSVLKNMLEHYNEIIRKAKTKWFKTGIIAFAITLAIIIVISANFIYVLSEQSFLNAIVSSAKLFFVPIMVFISALCINEYRKDTEYIKHINKIHTIEEIDKGIDEARSKSEEYSKDVKAYEDRKRNKESILELEQQIETVEKEIKLVVASRDRAITIPQVEELLNQEFQTNSELDLIRERRNPKK